MDLIACTCSDLPPHDHVPARVTLRFSDGSTVTISKDIMELNKDVECEIIAEHDESIHVWVDWKSVARDQMTEA